MIGSCYDTVPQDVPNFPPPLWIAGTGETHNRKVFPFTPQLRQIKRKLQVQQTFARRGNSNVAAGYDIQLFWFLRNVLQIFSFLFFSLSFFVSLTIVPYCAPGPVVSQLAGITRHSRVRNVLIRSNTVPFQA